MPEMKTPGVYIVETNAFPNSVVAVATAVPAFIGYTARADNQGKSLAGKPWRISSMAEFEACFGAAPAPKFSIVEIPAVSSGKPALTHKGTDYGLQLSEGKSAGHYLLYYSMQLFFKNGGSTCYVVSAGDYQTDIKADSLRNALDSLADEQEPTLIVIPDAVLLKEADCMALQRACLEHCATMKNRMAIVDIFNGHRARQHPHGDCIDRFRSAIDNDNLEYGAAYYPWVNASVVDDGSLGFENIANIDKLQDLLRSELGIPASVPAVNSQDDAATQRAKAKTAQLVEWVNSLGNNWSSFDEADALFGKVTLNRQLAAVSPLFKTVVTACKNRLNLLPPSAAMAGVYTLTDNTVGVWKAPANVSLNAVISPAVPVSNIEQEDLNVTPTGKSINGIRQFPGKGTLVWGARTLAGNDQDWRYINVRRTMIMLEQSLKLACQAYIFEANNANTWATIQSMAENFLINIWRQGGLAGATAREAFAVKVGLGQTMTARDITDGMLRVMVMVAIIKPAEFMVINLEQKMTASAS